MRHTRLVRRLAAVALVALSLGVAPSLLGADTLLGTLPVGIAPSAIAVNPLTHKAFVTNYYGDSVSVIDGVTEGVVATVPMPLGSSILAIPNAVVVDFLAARPTAYVANFWSDKLVMIDEASLTVTATVGLAGVHASGPRALALDGASDPPKLYIANYGAATLGVHDARTGLLIKELPVGIRPRSVAVFSSAGRERVYVANRDTNDVTVIDGATDEVITTLPAGLQPKAVVVHPSTGTAYVANEASGTVTVIGDSDTVVANVYVGLRPVSMAVDVARGRLFVANFDGGYVSVIDTTTNALVAQVPVGGTPWGIAFDSVRRKAIVACYGSDSVSFIDDALGVTSVNVGDQPYGIAVDETLPGPRTYVADWGSNTVSILGDPLIGSADRLLAPRPAYAAEQPEVDVTIGTPSPSTVGIQVRGSASDLRTPYVSDIVAVFFRLDDAPTWSRATITSGAGTPNVTWKAVLGRVSPTTHQLHVAVVDQAGSVASSGETGNLAGGVFGGVASASIELYVDTRPPLVSAPVVDATQVPTLRLLTVRASADDSTSGRSTIRSMHCRIDSAPPIPMSAEDGAFDERAEDGVATFRALLPPGRHYATVTATDARGNTGVSRQIVFEVVPRGRL